MLKRTVSVIAIVIATLFTIYLFYVDRSMQSFSTGPFPMDWSVDIPDDDTAFGGLFYEPEVNDSLPYYQYRRIEDSIKQIQNAIKSNNRSIGSGRGFGAISVSEITEVKPFWWKTDVEKDPIMRALQDSLDMLGKKMIGLGESDSLKNIKKLLGEVEWRYNVRSNELLKQNQQRTKKRYYLGLNGYSTNDHNTQFFLDKNGYNLAYVVWDGVRKRTFDSTMYGHYEHRSIPVRYSADEKKVLIPITKRQYGYASSALEWGFYLFEFLFIYFFVGIPLQIVWNISKGQAFTHKNIKRFRLMAFVLLVYALSVTSLPYILRLIFQDLIPKEFVLTSFTRNLLSQLPLYLCALSLYLVGKAFQRGYRLQQDNALTI